MNKIKYYYLSYKKHIVKRMNHRKRNKYRWKGAKNDLMEVVYCLYLTKKVNKASGEAITLYEMTETIYKLFGLEPPQNPSRVVNSLRDRVNHKKRSIFYHALSDLYHEHF